MRRYVVLFRLQAVTLMSSFSWAWVGCGQELQMSSDAAAEAPETTSDARVKQTVLPANGKPNSVPNASAKSESSPHSTSTVPDKVGSEGTDAITVGGLTPAAPEPPSGGESTSPNPMDRDPDEVEPVKSRMPDVLLGNVPKGRAARILPIGDTTTAGYKGQAGYRYFLWKRLQEKGYAVDFVGTLKEQPEHRNKIENPVFPTDYDVDHDGHKGWRTGDMLASFASLAKTMPDVILLHIGNNDVQFDGNAAGALANIKSFIERMRQANPAIVVLLSKVIPTGTAANVKDIDTKFNAKIPALAESVSTSASPVITVDHWTGFDWKTDNFNDYHPSESGEKKMAEKWLASLEKVLPR